VNTSALLATGFSRTGTLPATMRSAGVVLTVVIAATIDRCLLVQILRMR
jgi:hypothetical protein